MKRMVMDLSTNCYKLCPKTTSANVDWRVYIMEWARERDEHRDLLMRLSAENILFWINSFVWSLDTREETTTTTTPFITFKVQDEAILTLQRRIKPPLESIVKDGHLKRRRDVLIRKSRDMGATWICLLVYMHFLLFDQDFLEFFALSYKKEYVDGGPKSIFGKVDHMIDHLPSWMLPHGKLIRTADRIENPATGSYFWGDTTTDRSGVGSRFTSGFFDEFPRVDPGTDQQIFDATADCTRCRIFNGTHRGTHTMFARIEKMDDVEKLSLPWWEHPTKSVGLYRWRMASAQPEILDKQYEFPVDYKFRQDDEEDTKKYPGGKLRSAWYDYECAGRGWNKIAIAQDLDMDAAASDWLFFDAGEIDRLVREYARPADLRGDFSGRVFHHLTSGPMEIWGALDRGGRLPRDVYGLAFDLATGTGGKSSTPSCVSMVNLTTGRKVGSYKTVTKRPEQMAKLAYDLGNWLYGAMVIWEQAGGMGGTFKRVLIDELHYPYVFLRKTKTKTLAPEMTMEPGWAANNENKEQLLNDYRDCLSTSRFMNFSQEALEETKLFKWVKGGKIVHPKDFLTDDPSGAGMNHGDQVIADALANLLVMEHGVVKAEVDRQNDDEERGDPLNPPYGSIAWRDREEEMALDAEDW